VTGVAHEPTSMIGPLRPVSEIKMSAEDVKVPVDRYVSREFLEKEKTLLWPKVWQLVCREDELAEAGDYYEYLSGDQSYLLVRDADGAIQAMYNVCVHRGNIIKTGTGNLGKSIICPFHMWSYNLDGSLRKITDRETFCDLDDAKLGLKKVAVDTWAGWVFINPDADNAMPLLEFLSPIPEILAPYHLEYLTPLGLNLTTTVSANWKVAVEAFLEVYHVHAIHPQLLPNGDDVNVLFEHWELHSRMTRTFGVPSPRLGEVELEEIVEALFGPAPDTDASDARPIIPGEGTAAAVTDPDDRRSRPSNGGSGDYFKSLVHDVGSPWEFLAPYRDEDGTIELPDGVTLRTIFRQFYERSGRIKGVDFSGLEPDQIVDNFHYLIFPNVIVNVNLGSILFFRFNPDPHDPNMCTWDMITFDWIVDPQRAKEVRSPHKIIAEKAESLGILLDQDVEQMPRVQRGIRTGGIEHMTLSRQESRLLHFNAVLDRQLASG
jgi:phenylpropionate dioxygenase-like ring-hydroxylating dioxygenase large terminal subunit